MIEQFIKYFVLLFVVIEPVSLVPLFGALTRGEGDDCRRRIAFKSTTLAASILFAFAFAGDYLLRALGISFDAFKIAGGLLLFLLAVDMVFARQSGLRSTTLRERDEARYREDISVFPMAFPLIAGPGSLATVLLLVGETGGDWIMLTGLLVVLTLILGLTLVFRSRGRCRPRCRVPVRLCRNLFVDSCRQQPGVQRLLQSTCEVPSSRFPPPLRLLWDSNRRTD